MPDTSPHWVEKMKRDGIWYRRKAKRPCRTVPYVEVLLRLLTRRKPR